MYGLYDEKRLEKKELFGKLPFERLYGLYKKLFEYLELEYIFRPERIPAYAGIFLTGVPARYEVLGNLTKIIAIIVLLVFCAYTILSMRPAPERRKRKKRNKLLRAFERGFLLGLNNLAINLDEIEHLQFLVRIAINLVLMYMML
jgi:hypothetical protein